MPKSQKTLHFHDRDTRYGYFRKWSPLKQLYFSDLYIEGIFSGPKAKFLVMKSWSSEVLSDFLFVLMEAILHKPPFLESWSIDFLLL